MISSSARCGWLAPAWLLLLGCGATVDPLGAIPSGTPSAEPPAAPAFDSDTLLPLNGPASYPNAFRDQLGKSEDEIASKLDAAFERLFHGDPATQAIYYTVGSDQAYIQDIFHGDTRSEGVALGMLIALELDRKDELDRLWRFAKSSLRYASGPNQGYFRSTCASGPCADPFGHQVLAMVLLLAHGRYGSHSGDIDYGAEALATLHALRHRASDDGAVTEMFDPQTLLVVDEPEGSAASRTRPSCVMPAFYELWAQATADESWREVASAGRVLLEAAAHPTSGLLPLRAEFDGVAVTGSGDFEPEAYRAQLNMTLDHVFFEPSSWYTEESDRLLGFFAGEGLDLYGATYPLDGSRCLQCGRSGALVAMNGASAVAATHPERAAFIEAVWEMVPPEGEFRYYDGLLHLLSLLVLSGQLRVY